MSAKGRGQKLGGENDQYPTPHWCVERLFEEWRPAITSENIILAEPCCGDGNIINAVNNLMTEEHSWLTWDIDPKYDATFPENFLKLCDTWDEVEAVITNPPYSLAEEFVRHCLKVFPQAEIVMLLRLAFLESEDRRPLFEEIGVPDIFVLPNRPSFRSAEGKTGSTDQAAYAWMKWIPVDKGVRNCGQIKILNSTPIHIRRPSSKERMEECSTLAPIVE